MSAWSGGVWSACSGGCLPGPGAVVCLVGGMVSALGGCLPGWGGISKHALRQTPLPPVDRQTPVKILPWPNFVAAGNKEYLG